MKETRFKQTKIGLIPEDWNLLSVGKDCTVKARIGWQGLTTSEYMQHGNYALITSTDIVNGKINWSTCFFVTKFRYEQDKNIIIKAGDILVSKDGTIGKVGIVSDMPFPATLNSGVFVIRTKDTQLQHATALAFISPYFKDFIRRLTAGSTIVHLYQKDIVKFVFPVSNDISEQNKIASALTSIDNLLLSLKMQIEKKRLIKQGAMQELLTGKKKLPGFTGKWVERQVKDIGSIGRGRVISQKEIERSYQHKYPVYSSQTQNNGIMGYIDTYDFEGEYITWTTDGVNAGTVFYRNGLFNCTNVCGTIKLHKDNHLFVSMRLGLETNNYVSTNLANPKLMNNVMKQIVIDLPETVEEQKAIASVLSSMDKEIESLECKKTKYEQIKQGMMQQLLTGKIRLI